MDQSNGHHSGWRSWDTGLEMMEYRTFKKRHMENGDADMPFTGFLDLL